MQIKISKGQLLRLPEVLTILPISRTTFYEGIRLGIYPKPVRLGKRTVAWWSGELIEAVQAG
jgi:prophage regulatory protein